MIELFLLKAVLAGIGIAIVAGPLGSFVLWRKMAFFGDTLAHATLLGISVALLFNIHVYFGLIGICVAVALLLGVWQPKKLAQDAVLGVVSHTTLALGLILVSALASRVDLLGFLYGDILAVTWQDLTWILGVDAIVLSALLFIWKPLLSITVHQELAQVEGVAVQWIQLCFMILMALVFAIAMRLVGVLLITALLVIPASTARQFAHTPEQMAALASIIGIVASGVGVGGSMVWDIPTGPAIVMCSAVLFLGSVLVRR